jgi:HEAT repeat protein
MQSYLQDLVSRMTVQERVMNSEESISWHAHREAESLQEIAALEELNTFLRAGPPKAERSAAYFMLGALGNNLKESKCASTLISHIPSERDKHALASLLDSLAKVPAGPDTDLEPVYGLLRDRRWLVRHGAIRALRISTAPETEDRLLAVLVASSDPHDKIYCHAVLNLIGTLKSVPALQAGLESSKRDVKLSAKAAMQEITLRAAAERRPRASILNG